MKLKLNDLAVKNQSYPCVVTYSWWWGDWIPHYPG